MSGSGKIIYYFSRETRFPETTKGYRLETFLVATALVGGFALLFALIARAERSAATQTAANTRRRWGNSGGSGDGGGGWFDASGDCDGGGGDGGGGD
ncbi:hypothetical protein CO667_16535 [Rhizobium sp. L43]|nr:hypothetical protein CO667_16535 [Rhizobium sp. L43]